MDKDYDARLTNADLAPVTNQGWGAYDIFAFWMSDVHSVGGYVTAGSLFALGLMPWQILIVLVTGIVGVQILCGLIAKPSQQTGTPFPVVCRMTFGVRGANIPALVRGLIAVAWYGIQTYLASSALLIVALKFFPALAAYADRAAGFAGLSALGWGCFLLLWALQAMVFWRGMESIRRFIEWAGPAVYVVMIALAVFLVWKAGVSNIHLTLEAPKFRGWAALPVMVNAAALVVSYFSGPMLNFGDFARYVKTPQALKSGNFWGLPVNFLGFSLLVVVTTSATQPVFGHMITDPVETVSRIDNTFAVVLGALTFVAATIGINVVANFISPAFDFSNMAPQRISWRAGGMIAAVASIFITPWNIYNSPAVIHYTLDVLGAVIGPIFGVIIADFYGVKGQAIEVSELYVMRTSGRYWYRHGFNARALGAVGAASIVAVACALVPPLAGLENFTWFIGATLGAAVYLGLQRQARGAEP